MATWLRLISVSTSLNSSLLLCISRIWMRDSRRSTSLQPPGNFSSSSTLKELEGFTLRICSLPPSSLNFTNLGRRDTPKRISDRIGSQFSFPLLFTIDSTSLTPTKTGISRRKTCLNTQRGFPRSLLIGSSKNTRQWTERWTTKAFWNSCWLWTTKRLHRQSNISGGYWMFITRVLSIPSSLTCSSAPSSKSCKQWRNAASMWRISRTRSSIWPSLNYLWPFPWTIWSNVNREISLYPCLSTQRHSSITINAKTAKPWKSMMIFDIVICTIIHN